MPPLKPIPIEPKIMWRIHGNFATVCDKIFLVDLAGPFTPTSVDGNRYIAIAVCAFSKFVEAQGKPIKHQQIIISFFISLQNKLTFGKEIYSSTRGENTLILTDCNNVVV